MHTITRKQLLWVLLLVVLASSGTTAQAMTQETVNAIHLSAQGYLHYSLGRLMEVEGMPREALVQYGRAESFLHQSCELSRAQARVQMILGRLDDALGTIQEAGSICPDDLELLAVHAEVLLARGEPAAAESLLIGVVTETGSPSRLTALLGQSQMSQGRLEDAAATLSSRALRDSLNPEMAFLHARSLMALGRWEQALSELQRAYRLEPTNGATVGLLGEMLLRAGRYEELVSLLENVTRSLTARQEEFLSLGRAYAAIGRYDDALAILDEAEQTWGESERLLAARGAVELASGAEDDAIETFERILALEPDSVVALNFIAYHWSERGKHLETALEYATRAVELVPENPRVRDTLGWVYLALGRGLEAVQELEAAVELGARDSLIHEHLGDAYMHVGRTTSATESWLKALELEPGRASTLERLEQASGGSGSSE